MKRAWIGFLLLLVLLGSSILFSQLMVRIHEPVEADLQQAAECAALGDWVNADRFFLQAKDHWKKWEHFRACFADHTPVEEADADFALLEVYSQMREDAAFAAGCQELARKTAAVGEAHEFVWWNIF